MRGRIDYRNPERESLAVMHHDLRSRGTGSPRQPHKEGARGIISLTLLSSFPGISCWDSTIGGSQRAWSSCVVLTCRLRKDRDGWRIDQKGQKEDNP